MIFFNHPFETKSGQLRSSFQNDPIRQNERVERRQRASVRAAHLLDIGRADAAGPESCDPVSPKPTPHIPLWKRSLDIAGVLIAAPCLLPLLIMIALAIKLGSRGPLFYTQERIGLLGKRFVIFKFRTMTVGADTGVHEAHTASLIDSDKPMTKLDARGDARLIRCGRLLRAAGLDELPQLINVWRGEMSFVGPRPCLPSESKRYLPWQRERFMTPPGLTGLWQVSGKNRTTFNEMVKLDIDYVRRRSLWLDLVIIMRTMPAVAVEVRDLKQPCSDDDEKKSDGDDK